MKFLGRDSELQALMEAWQRALSGSPQAVVVAGEAQLGKTRIVQEFYAHLSAAHDPEHYWPAHLERADNSLHLTPAFLAGNESTAACPWLWWAVRWPPPKARNPGVVDPCAVLAGANHLRPHVEAAQRWRARRAVERNAAIGAGKTLLNLATLGSAGTAIEIFERFQDWWSVRQAAADGASSVAERARRTTGTQLEDLQELLRIFCFSPVVSDAGVPLILVLDDAHWADTDSLAFLEQLLVAARRTAGVSGKIVPKLLIVATCFEREWNAADAIAVSAGAGASNATDEAIVRTIAGALRQAERDQQLTLRVLRLSRLADPVGVQLVAAQWPGLTPSQTALVAGRAGGNPGLLTEVLQKLQRSRHLFAKSDPSGPLTTSGERVVREMSVAYHGLVEERLAQIEADDADGVTELMRIASYLGMQFSAPVLAELLERLARAQGPARTADGVMRALLRAETPLALIQSLVAQLREFRLPVYREVLERQLCESDDLLATVRASVMALILDCLEGTSLTTLSAAERDVFLAFAAGELEARGASDVQTLRIPLLGVLAEQLKGLERSGRHATIRALVDRWFTVWMVDQPLSDLLLREGRIVSVLRCALFGDRPDVVLALAAPLQRLETPVTGESNLGEDAFEVRTLEALAFAQLGRHAEAVRAHEALLDIAEEQIRARPDDESAWHQLSWAAGSLVSVLWHPDNEKRVLQLSQRALDVSRERLQRWGVSRERRLSVASDALTLAMQWIERARAGREQSGFESALTLLEETQAQLAACRQESGDDALSLRRQSHVHGYMADILWARGERDRAVTLERESGLGFAQLIERYGESADRLMDVAQYQSSLALRLLALRPRIDAEVLSLIEQSWWTTNRALQVYGETPLRLDRAAILGGLYVDVLLDADRQANPDRAAGSPATPTGLSRVAEIATTALEYGRRAIDVGGATSVRQIELCQLLGRVINCHLARHETVPATELLAQIVTLGEHMNELDPAGRGATIAQNARAMLARLALVAPG